MKKALSLFDEYLKSKNLKFECIVIGAGAMIIMDIITRNTRDIDCLDPHIPEEIKNASIEFANLNPDLNLIPDWLNNGPIDLTINLPKNWRSNLQDIFNGKALRLKTLSRSDFILTKLFAFCDRQTDLHDCIALRITLKELQSSYSWVADQDANSYWPKHVKLKFIELGERLGFKYYELS